MKTHPKTKDTPKNQCNSLALSNFFSAVNAAKPTLLSALIQEQRSSPKVSSTTFFSWMKEEK
jgi:hypothetical protein